MKPVLLTEPHHQLLEQYAERTALAGLRGATFTHCLKSNELAPSIEIITLKNQKVTIHGRDLSNEQTWKKFLATQSSTLDLCRLTTSADLLVQNYRTWLLTTYTPRYQQLSKRADLLWFEQVTILVVVRKIMERKYEAFTYEQRDAFADPWVADEMSILMRLNTMTTEIARTIHHIVKQPETAQAMIEQVYETHATHLEQRPMHPRAPLAPLPTGISLPQVLLSGERERPHADE